MGDQPTPGPDAGPDPRDDLLISYPLGRVQPPRPRLRCALLVEKEYIISLTRP